MMRSILTGTCLFVLTMILCVLGSSKVYAQAITEEVQAYEALPPVLTHSPADTLRSLQSLHDALIEAMVEYGENKTSKNFDRVSLIADALISLLDLSDENVADRRDTSITTVMALIDIVENVDVSAFETLPGRETGVTNLQNYYPVPGTPLQLQRIDEGPREGEFLFSSNSSKIAPRFLREIATQSPEQLNDLWSTKFLQISGPTIPDALASNLPDFALTPVWGTPVWKIFATFIAILATLAGLSWVNRLMKRWVASGKLEKCPGNLVFALITVASLYAINRFTENQLILTGSFARTETLAATLAISGALAWTFWRAMEYLSYFVERRRKFAEQPYDASVLRLVNHLIGLIGAVWILAYGAQTLGFPLLSILAGLGVGGLAVALAIRPTLENLISGFVLYIEQSVKVGDYCSFSGQSGTVERIGVRSTHVRAIDRTLIAIPNSKFVDMELVNWARCDEMLIHAVIGLRYETDTEQLRYVLAEIRRMMHSHPRISNDTVRVRFLGYGASSLDIDVRVYAQTREWNDFYAIREDVLFRIKEIVENSGTGFAFPSQTVYVSRDGGLDETKTQDSVEKVRGWRRKRLLPFPNFSTAERETMEDSLRYPPPESPEYNGPDEERSSVEEPLSAEEPSPNEETPPDPDQMDSDGTKNG